MKIDTTNWEEFRVDKLFDYERGKESAPNQNLSGDCKLISEISDNNGFVRFVKPTKRIKGHCLTVSVNFADIVFYQEDDFCASVNVMILRPKFEMSKNQLLFIASVMSKQHNIYSYTDKISKTLLMKEHILLPAIDPDTPDFDYMEKYIEEIKLKYIDKLEKDNDLNIDKALEVTGLSYEDLDKDLIVEPADRYEEFRVGDLFEAITKTALGSFTKRSKKTDNYIVPALSSTVNNHSLGYYVKEKDHKIIDRVCLSVTSNGDAGKVYLQNKPFTIAQDAYAIYLKDDGRENVYLFIATVLEKLLIQKYNYTNKAGWTKVQNEVISLPSIDKDTPDFDYMEKAIYIYTAKKIKLKKLSNEKEIELLRSII